MAETETIVGEFLNALAAKILMQVGHVERECHVATEPQAIDLAFAPDSRANGDHGLGWFGRLAAEGPCMVECFSWTPSLAEVDACLRKQLNYHHQRAVEAKREHRPLPPQPLLWFLVPGRPEEAMVEYSARPMAGWPAGFWRCFRSGRARIVIARELPRERDTLLLRLHGQGKTFVQAAKELERLPAHALEKRLVASVGVALPGQLAHARVQETNMSAVQALERLEALGKQALQQERQEGRQEGRLEGEQAILMRLLTRRFGPLPARVRARIEKASTDELERWSDRVLDARSLAEVFAQT